MFSYPHAYLRLALGAFYFFIALQGFCWTARELPATEILAAVGTGCAAAMWWTIESMHSRREFPYVSTWSGVRFWMLVIPAYVLATRPRKPAMKLIALQVLSTTVVFLAAAIVGALAFPR